MLFALERCATVGAAGTADCMALAILFGVFAALLALGVSVAVSLCAASLATLLYLGLPARRADHRDRGGHGLGHADRDSAVHLRRATDAARRHVGAADRIRLGARRSRARRSRSGQRAVVPVLRRSLGLGDRRRVGDRRDDDSANGRARLRSRLRRERDDLGGSGRVAGTALAQLDPVLRRRPAAGSRSPTCSRRESCPRCCRC